MVIRLPKFADHPKLEAIEAPVIPQRDLNALLRTWRLIRKLNDDEIGDMPDEGCR
jgi:hypothetical protein